MDKSGNTLGEFSDLSAGQAFAVDAASDSLDAITTFEISGWGNGADAKDCFVHTFCSQPLVRGDQIGPFVVTSTLVAITNSV